MKIQHIHVKNFRGFEDFELTFDEQFTLLVGGNGTGKTGILSAVSVALGIWHVSSKGTGWRKIEPHEIRLRAVQSGDRLSFEPCKPVEITAEGRIDDESVTWTRMIRPDGQRTTNANAKEAITIIRRLVDLATERLDPLPVLAFYGSGRAWIASNERTESRKANGGHVSRWDAYYDSLNERIRLPDLLNWFVLESAARDPSGRYRPGFETVRRAIQDCLPDCTEVSFDHQRLEPVFSIGGQQRLFSNLSDGQKSMAALIADIAIRAVTLNSFLLNDSTANEASSELPIVLRRTPGVVLIDELDVHLHPSWQRRVVSDLMRTFPRMQFICTTHSPQVIGEVSRRVYSLEDEQAWRVERAFGLDSSRVLGEVMHSPARNTDIEGRLRDIGDLIDSEQFVEAKTRLAELAELIGEGDPEITRAQAMMTFLEAPEA